MFYDPTDTLHALGITAPAGIDDANAMAAEVRALAFEKPAEVMPHTTTAATVVDDFREYVIARDLHKYAQEMSRYYERHAADQVRELYRAEAPRILAELAKAAPSRLKVVTGAARHIGPDDDGNSVIERDKAAVDAWRNREAIDHAAEELRQIRDITENLARLSGTLTAETPVLLWWTSVEDHNHLERIKANEWSRTDCPGGRLLALAHAGHTIALATPEQAQARAADVDQARHAQATQWQRQKQAAEAAKNQREGRAWIDALTR